MAISPLNSASIFFNINAASSKRETATPVAEAGNVNSSQKACLYNSQTGKTMTTEEAEQLFQQVTSQPHWNRNDVNFYVQSPVAMILPGKASAAAGEVNMPAATADGGEAENRVGAESDTQTEQVELYNPQTGKTLAPEEASELFQQITSQPNWNRHDVNFYVSLPTAMNLPGKEPGANPDIKAADSEIGVALAGAYNVPASAAAPAAETAAAENAAPLVESEPASTPVLSTPAETRATRNYHLVQPQAPEPVMVEDSPARIVTGQPQTTAPEKYENEDTDRKLALAPVNNRNVDYYQLWLETLADTYIEYNEFAGEELPDSPEHRFWDVKV